MSYSITHPWNIPPTPTSLSPDARVRASPAPPEPEHPSAQALAPPHLNPKASALQPQPSTLEPETPAPTITSPRLVHEVQSSPQSSTEHSQALTPRVVCRRPSTLRASWSASQHVGSAPRHHTPSQQRPGTGRGGYGGEVRMHDARTRNNTMMCANNGRRTLHTVYVQHQYAHVCTTPVRARMYNTSTRTYVQHQYVRVCTTPVRACMYNTSTCTSEMC